MYPLNQLQSLPLLGTSLQDELNLAIEMEKSTDNQQQQHDEEEGRRKKFSATEDELPPSQDLVAMLNFLKEDLDFISRHFLNMHAI